MYGETFSLIQSSLEELLSLHASSYSLEVRNGVRNQTDQR